MNARALAGLRRWVAPFWVGVLATVVAATGVEGQWVFGVHVSRAPDLFRGADGLGVRAGVQLGPVGAGVMGDWYDVDCAPGVGECHYRSGALVASVEVPGPVARPYVVAGVGLRDLAPGPGASVRTTVVGFGLRLDLGPAGLFGEATGELPDDGPTQLVLRVGARF